MTHDDKSPSAEEVEALASFLEGKSLHESQGGDFVESGDDLAFALRALLADRARLTAERDAALRVGYLAGFMASGEGWNGEYPFEGVDPEQDDYWTFRREEVLAARATPTPEGDA